MLTWRVLEEGEKSPSLGRWLLDVNVQPLQFPLAFHFLH